MAEIALTRPGGYKTDRLRPYQIYLDGEKVGRIRAGATEALSVSSGHHDLRLKMDWTASEKLEVELGDDGSAKCICGPRVKENGVGILIGCKQTYWMTLGCRRYIDLRAGDDLAARDQPGGWMQRIKGPELFGVAQLVGIAVWAVTGQSLVIMGVVVAGIALVVSGLIGRGLGKAAVRATEDLQKRREADKPPG